MTKFSYCRASFNPHAQALPLSVYRFEVLADLQAPVSTLLYVCFPGECRQIMVFLTM